MIFNKTKLDGAYNIQIDKKEDERGFFGRTWDSKEFEKRDLKSQFVQCNVSLSLKKGTIRGLHYQEKPYQEAKLIRCTRGKVFNVIVDLRPESKTYKQWYGIELSSENYKGIYVPEGFAHGFQTLEDDTEVFYQMSEFYMAKYARGIKWNDESFDIKWPLNPTMMSQKDLSYQNFEEKENES